MKKFLDALITTILRSIAAIANLLNPKARQSLGKLIGRILKQLSSRRYNITKDNIKKALQVDDSRADAIALGAYRNLGITLVELTVLDKLSLEELHNYVKYENIELIHEAYNEGNGVILLSGHYGNWEYLAYTAGLFTQLPLTVVVKPQSNKFADKYLNRTRTSGGNKTVSMYNAARTIVKELNQGNIIALLTDQSASRNNDVTTEFFARKVPTYAAPSALSIKFNAPIIVGFANRMSDGSYYVKLSRIDPYEYQNDSDGVEKLTQYHVDILENEIRKHPELWAWQHRRWKHSPENND